MAFVNKSEEMQVSTLMYLPCYEACNSTVIRNSLLNTMRNNSDLYSFYEPSSITNLVGSGSVGITWSSMPSYYIKVNHNFNYSLNNCTMKIYDIYDLELDLRWTDTAYKTKTFSAQDIDHFIDQGGKIYYYNTSKSLDTSIFVDITNTLIIPTGFTFNIILYIPGFTNVLDVGSSTCFIFGQEIIMKPVAHEPITFPNNISTINDLYEEGDIFLYNSASSSFGASSYHYLTFHETREDAFKGSGKNIDEIWEEHEASGYTYLNNKVFYVSMLGSTIEEIMGGIIYDYSSESELRIETEYYVYIDYVEYEADNPVITMPNMVNNIKIGNVSLNNIITPTNQLLPNGIIIPIRQTSQGPIPDPMLVKIGAVYKGNTLIYGIDPSTWSTNSVTKNDGWLIPNYGELDRSHEVDGYVLAFSVDGFNITDSSLGEYDSNTGKTRIYYRYREVQSEDTAECTIKWTSILPTASDSSDSSRPDPLPSEQINLRTPLVVYIGPTATEGDYIIAEGSGPAAGYTLYIRIKSDGSVFIEADYNDIAEYSYDLPKVSGSDYLYSISSMPDLASMPVIPENDFNDVFIVSNG